MKLFVDPDQKLKDAIEATEKLRREATRDAYSKLRNEREKATFAMMMRMNPAALTAVRKEFFARQDSVSVNEFIYIINKHLGNSRGDSRFVMETAEQREFGTNMYALFKDIDVNGDGNLEWQEFTTFTVEKANLLNKRQKMASIANYHDTTDTLDASAHYRHRHDISRFLNIAPLSQFAMLEDHKNSVYIFNSRLAKHIKTITTEAAPTALEYVADKDKDILVTALADMTLATYSLTDPNPLKRYQHQSSWATPGVQIALAYQPESKLLYSGGVNYNVYSWKIHERNLVSTLSGHTDIVMSLINLKKLNNIASASLDKTVCVWDSYTNERILHLHGHKKGVFDLAYSTDYRLLFSCGFEHDACVWSPFVNSLVFRLKGHHSSLVGCQTVEGTAEVITADTSGVFKLWDVRNFQCVQTFNANLSGQETKDSSKMTAFFHTKLVSRNAFQREDDSRIYAASKMIFSFDQARVVHEATSDKCNIFWVAWSEDACQFITVSERNVIVWDGLLGSKTVANLNICGEEISACCLDDRKRKIVIGNVRGKIGVYNPSNGALMKSVVDDNTTAVVAIEYVNETRRFIAGFANGYMKIFDENTLEDCAALRTFESFNMHPELLTLSFNQLDKTVASAGASSGVARLWNYNTGKCEIELNVCVDETDHIVYLKYMHPYPLILTSDSVGNIAVWGSSGSKFQGVRIAGFLNQTVQAAIMEIKKTKPDEDESPARLLVPDIHTSHDNNDLRDDDGDDESSLNSSAQSSVVTAAMAPPDVHNAQISSSLKLGFKQLTDESNYQDDPDIIASLSAARDEYIACEKKWGKASPAQGMCWHLEEKLVFLADDLGRLRCFEVKDLLKDIHADAMLLGRGRGSTKRICMERERTSKSALAPSHSSYVQYFVGNPTDANSYLGVNFIWAINAHHDRIISCTTTSRGILTSAADRLVKMWTLDGQLIGVLKQSVPIGAKSQAWHLDIDVEQILVNEKEELDGVIERVTILSQKKDMPDINHFDFSGMEPGVHAADFSKSELRLRIAKSGQLLGLNFPRADDFETQSESSYLESNSDHYNNIDSHSIASKALGTALKELKSVTPSVDYVEKTRQMTLIQRKRKTAKLDIISKEFKEKAGMKIALGDDKHGGYSGGIMPAGDIAELDQLISLASTHGSTDESSINNDLYSINSVPYESNVTKESNVMKSIKNFSDSGRRTIALKQSCLKFSSFSALDKALESSMKPSNGALLSKEDLIRLKARRDTKANRLQMGGSNVLSSRVSKSQQGLGQGASGGRGSFSSSNNSQSRVGTITGTITGTEDGGDDVIERTNSIDSNNGD